MYTEYVSLLYMSKSEIDLVKNGKPLPYNSQVIEHCRLCGNIEGLDNYSPDFYVEGKLEGKTFHIGPGPNTLYITGVANRTSLSHYHLPKVKLIKVSHNKSISFIFQIT
jgi:hypothetical protein